MHSYTLNNWDGSQSQKEAEINTVKDTKNNPKHAPSREHVQSIFSATSRTVPTENVERTNDASYESQVAGSHDWKKSEELGDKGLLVTNGSNNSHDSTSRRNSRYPSELAAVISQAYGSPAPRFQSKLPPVGSTSNDQAQDQATLLPRRSVTRKLASGSVVWFSASTRTTYSRSTPHHDQGLLGGDLNLSRQSVPHSQNRLILPTPASPNSVQTPTFSVPQVRQPTAEVANGQGVGSPINRQMPPIKSDVTLTSIPSQISSLKKPQATLASARLNNGKDIKPIIKTFSGTRESEPLQSLPKHQPTQPLSSPSVTTGTAVEATKTYSKVSQVHPALASRKCDKFTPIVSPSPSLYQPSALSPQVSRSWPLVSLSIHDLPLQQTIPSSVSVSPGPSSDPHDHDDDYTSADADGESVDNTELDTLGLSQATTSSNATIIHHPSHHVPSAYGLFTPSTRSPSEISGTRKSSRPRTYLAYIEIPPLPPGKHKTDYRPPKDDRYLERQKVRKEEPLEYRLSDRRRAYLKEREKERKEEREIDVQAQRVRKKLQKRERQKVTGATQTKSPASTVVPIVPSNYMSYQRRSQRKKSLSLASSIRETPPESVSSVRNLVAGAGVPRCKPKSSASILSVSSRSDPSLSVPSPPLDQSGLRPNPITASVSNAPGSIIHPIPFQLLLSNAVDTIDSSLQEPKVQRLPVHTAEHPPPAVTYFHTRFVQNEVDPDEWTVLGTLVSKRCAQACGSILDGPPSIRGSEGEEGEGAELGVGGTVLWGGCSSDEEKEEEQQSQVIQGQKLVRAGVKMKEMLPRDERRSDLMLSTGSVKDSLDDVSQPPMTPIPKVDLSKAWKAQKTASMKKSRAKERVRDVYADVSELVTTSDTRRVQTDGTSSPSRLSSSTTFAQPHPQPQAVAQSSPFQQYLSEKARGKQRAIDTIPTDTASNHATLSSPTAASGFRDQNTYSPTNTTTDSYQPVNPLEMFDKNMEEYFVFDMESPYKRRESEGDPSSARIPEIIPGLSPPSSMRPPGDPFCSESNRDLFPAFSTSISGPSVFDSLGEFNPFEDPFVASLSNEEGVQQMTTINPAFLDGSCHENWSNGDISATQLELEFGGMTTAEEIEGEESMSEEEEMRVKPYEDVSRAGYQPVAGVPIVVSSSSSSSSSRLQSFSGRPGSTPLVDVTGGTSSPEFSGYYTNNQWTSAQATTSHSSPSFIPVQRKHPGLRIQPVMSGYEAEGEEIQKDLDAPEVSSTSGDEYDGSTDSEDLSLSRPTRHSGSVMKKKSPKAKPSPAMSTPALAATPAKVVLPAQQRREWECGNELSPCHQCRTRSYKLKMTCLCKKKFCNRCTALRYPSMLFRLQLDECPYCRNECNCDQCTRKRGEDYVSLKVSLGDVPRERKTPIAAQKTRVLSKNVYLPPPEPISNVAGPFTFWGSIYDFDGNKIATAFAGPEEDKVIVATAVGGYTRSKPTEYAEGEPPATRTFIGTCQPSWRLGRDPIIEELGKKQRPRRVGDMFQGGNHETRWFVGKECLLYRPVVVYSRDLLTSNPFSDLSSLSSLSDDSDIEVDIGIPTHSQDTKIYTSGINATNSIKTAGIDDFDPNAVETRDTIRALVIALNDCGAVVKIDRTLADS
ncbi:hypothetical protein P691DRAFT_773119 [Macrolepiota fuliginosa MF-IS2]|uniref:Zinc-finger domain-containing protein n=1 Tax=Macrolepiota fuliginosa MF-IS2 TaxID=1400762 RepID=A0A9P5XKL8_9AGAR|nr:hypothetical protein P691DRAFT_773119 [Macrolepiota fuliginosa MF-IS2]